MRSHRLIAAMVAFVVLAVLAWRTLPDERIRWVTWAVLALFAVRTLVHWRRQQVEKRNEPM
jgi:heme A synthase